MAKKTFHTRSHTWQETCTMSATTQTKSCKPISSSSSGHFLPFVWLLSRAEAVWCHLADSCPAESNEHSGKLKRNQNHSGYERDSEMMTKQQTHYISVLLSTERLLTGCGWMLEGVGCVHTPSHTLTSTQIQPAALMSSLSHGI